LLPQLNASSCFVTDEGHKLLARGDFYRLPPDEEAKVGRDWHNDTVRNLLFVATSGLKQAYLDFKRKYGVEQVNQHKVQYYVHREQFVNMVVWEFQCRAAGPRRGQDECTIAWHCQIGKRRRKESGLARRMMINYSQNLPVTVTRRRAGESTGYLGPKFSCHKTSDQFFTDCGNIGKHIVYAEEGDSLSNSKRNRKTGPVYLGAVMVDSILSMSEYGSPADVLERVENADVHLNGYDIRCFYDDKKRFIAYVKGRTKADGRLDRKKNYNWRAAVPANVFVPGKKVTRDITMEHAAKGMSILVFRLLVRYRKKYNEIREQIERDPNIPRKVAEKKLTERFQAAVATTRLTGPVN
jgi:hypothetical protein